MDKKKSKIAYMQLIRSMAILLVVLSHLNYYSKTSHLDFAGFKIGVDLFFIISGFIIYYITFNKKPGFESAKLFLKKRLIRVIPVYWIFTIITALYFILRFKVINFTIPQIIGSLLFIPLGPQATQFHPYHPYLSVGWTLFFELAFYFSFAAFLFIKKEKRLWTASLYFLSTILIVNILGMNLNALHIGQNYLNLYFLFDGFLLEFLFGMLISHIYIKNIKISKKYSLIIFICSIVIFLSVLFYNEQTIRFLYDIIPINFSLHSNRIFVLGIPSALLILGLTLFFGQKRLKMPKWLIAPSNLAYSLYLSHVITIRIFAEIFYNILDPVKFNAPIISAIFFIAGITACLGVGYLSYRYVEKPVISYLREKLL